MLVLYIQTVQHFSEESRTLIREKEIILSTPPPSKRSRVAAAEYGRSRVYLPRMGEGMLRFAALEERVPAYSIIRGSSRRYSG